MSVNRIVLNNGQQAIINTDLSKIFVWKNRSASGTYVNSSYDDEILVAGCLLGRKSSNQYVKPLVSTASDGSQYPVGILLQDTFVAAGDSVEIDFCVEGDVVEAGVGLDAGDTMATVISGRSIRDRIGGDTVGIKLVGGDELTNYDNS